MLNGCDLWWMSTEQNNKLSRLLTGCDLWWMFPGQWQICNHVCGNVSEASDPWLDSMRCTIRVVWGWIYWPSIPCVCGNVSEASAFQSLTRLPWYPSSLTRLPCQSLTRLPWYPSSACPQPITHHNSSPFFRNALQAKSGFVMCFAIHTPKTSALSWTNGLYSTLGCEMCLGYPYAQDKCPIMCVGYRIPAPGAGGPNQHTLRIQKKEVGTNSFRLFFILQAVAVAWNAGKKEASGPPWTTQWLGSCALCFVWC